MGCFDNEMHFINIICILYIKQVVWMTKYLHIYFTNSVVKKSIKACTQYLREKIL